MMYLFLLLCVTFFIYSFFIRKRQFDFLTIYAFFLILFNLTTIFGVVVDPYSRQYSSASTELLFSTAIVFLVTSPFFYYKSSNIVSPSFNGDNRDIIPVIIFLYVSFFISCSFTLINLSSFISATSKKDIMESKSIFSILLGSLPIAGFFLSIQIRKYAFTCGFVLILLIIFISGSRSALALMLLVFIMIYMKGKILSLVTYWKVLFLLGGSLTILILGKSLYSLIINYGFSGVFIWYNSFEFSYLISGSEFLSTPAILDSVILNDFKVDGLHMLKSFLAIQPIPLSYFEFESAQFNTLFQGQLFAGIDYGMAYNPWAEGYAWFGYFGVLIYALVIPIVLLWFWKLYCISGYFGKTIFLILGLLLSFWVHRNSLASELAYFRNAIYPLAFIYIISTLLAFVFPKKNIKI